MPFPSPETPAPLDSADLLVGAHEEVDEGAVLAAGLRRARRAAGLTQCTVARALNCRQGVISSWERGEYRAPRSHVRRLVDLYRVEPGLARELVTLARDDSAVVVGRRVGGSARPVAPDDPRLGPSLRRARVAAGLTLEQAGAVVNRTGSAVYDWEYGHHVPGRVEVSALADLYGLRPRERDHLLALARPDHKPEYWARLRQELGAALKRERKRAGHSGRTAGQGIGLSQSTLCQIEGGHQTASEDTVDRLATLYGVDGDEREQWLRLARLATRQARLSRAAAPGARRRRTPGG